MTTLADTYKPRDKQYEYYSDFLVGFTPHPDNKQLVRSVNEQAVTRSIKNLIMTNKYERFRRPLVGSSSRNVLFEPISPQATSMLKNDIEETIKNHEPRASIISVTVVPVPDRNGYIATIVFSVRSNVRPITLSLPLTRIR